MTVYGTSLYATGTDDGFQILAGCLPSSLASEMHKKGAEVCPPIKKLVNVHNA